MANLESVTDALLDAVNEGSIVLKDGKFCIDWCSACRGRITEHFCECGEAITAETCQSCMGLCFDCYENSDYTPPPQKPFALLPTNR